MKKLITLLLLFTLVGFLSGNQVVITNDYQYIVSTGKTYNFSNGNPSNNVKYDRTNKIQIQNNKVIANPLSYHYAFFWQEDNTFIGYYKTNKGIATNGAYLGQVNTQSIPLPLNAYSFALVRYDNDYVLVNGYTIEELFIDNNLANVDPDDFNDIPIAELNGLTLNEVFDDYKWDTISFSGATLSGNVFTITGGAFLLNLVPANTYTTNDVLYENIKYQQSSIGAFTPRFRFLTTDLSIHPNDTLLNVFSSKFTSTVNANAVSTIRSFQNIGETYTFYYYYLVNLTELGIASLTKSQLDTYFSIYQNGVNATYYATDGNVSSVDGHYFAAGKNLFDKSKATINSRVEADGTFGTTTNSFRSDYIDIRSSTQYMTSGTSSGSFYDRVAFYDSSKTFISVTTTTPFTTPSNAEYLIFNLRPTITPLDTYQLEQGGTATTFEAFATPTTTLNLTFLFGIGNEPNKATMDGYYAEYEEYLEYLYVCCNIFATQTISFETIYFDDGVSTEIERLGSILIFTLIGFTLMIFGFASKRRIFNLLAVGAFIVLGFLLVDFVGFIIILFGLIFVNVYYTFFGEL
jgi:hypothetical protein